MRRALVSSIALSLGLCVLLLAATGGVAADDVTVDVTVVNQDGDPVGGAELTVMVDDESQTVTTTGSGAALFDVPEGADVNVTVDHPEYVRNFPYTIENAAVDEGESRLQAEIDVSLAGTLELAVQDSEEPVEEVRVLLRDEVRNDWVLAVTDDDTYSVSTGEGTSPNFRTAEDGTVTVERLEQHEYTAHTRKAGYLDTETTVSLDDDRVEETIQIETARVQVDFFVDDDHFDPPRPLADATIQIAQRGITLDTFDDGQQEQRLPVNTDYEIEVSKDGYDGVTETLALEEEATTFNVSIQRTPTVTLSVLNEEVVVGQSNRVTVTNAYDEPVANASILLNGEEVAQTNENGEADIEHLEDGEHVVTVEYQGLDDSVTVEAFEPGADDAPEDIQEMEDDADDTDDADDADDNGIGFGVIAALIAVGAVLVLALVLGLVRHRQ